MNGLRCKPDEICFVIAGEKSRGRIVKTIRLINVGEVITSNCGYPIVIAERSPPIWLVEGAVYRKTKRGKVLEFPAVEDCFLLPIRDPGDDAVDEMTLLAGKPEGVTA